jgi:hypothetical protein
MADAIDETLMTSTNSGRQFLLNVEAAASSGPKQAHMQHHITTERMVRGWTIKLAAFVA